MSRSHSPPRTASGVALLLWLGAVAPLLLIGCATPWLASDQPNVPRGEPVQATDNAKGEKPIQVSDSPPSPAPLAFASDDDSRSPSDIAQIQTESVPISTPLDPLGPGPVSLESVLAYARENHPSLKSKAQEIDLARAERLDASLFPNPRLVMDADGPVDGDNQPSLSTRVDFTLPIGGKRQSGMSAASAAEERARLELAYETDLVLLEVADAATQVLYLQELAKQQQELADLNARFASMQDRRAAQNIITDVDRLLADTSAKEAEFDRLRTLADLAQAQLLLAQAMGMTNPRPLVLSGELICPAVPPVPLETILAAARQVRPEFRAGDWGIREQQRRATLARANAIPDLTLSPRYGEEFDDDDDTLGARFATDLVFWNWNQGEIATALAATRQATADKNVYETTTLGDLAQGYVSLAPIQRQLDYYDTTVEPAMRESIASIEKAFELQAIDPAELSQQLNRLAKLKRAHLELRFLHQQARMRIEILLRRPLSSFAAVRMPAREPTGLPLPPP